jgi:hypothetical protein
MAGPAKLQLADFKCLHGLSLRATAEHAGRASGEGP